jgi:hypothetical protein
LYPFFDLVFCPDSVFPVGIVFDELLDGGFVFCFVNAEDLGVVLSGTNGDQDALFFLGG